jgi:hypothetical protein
MYETQQAVKTTDVGHANMTVVTKGLKEGLHIDDAQLQRWMERKISHVPSSLRNSTSLSLGTAVSSLIFLQYCQQTVTII